MVVQGPFGHHFVETARELMDEDCQNSITRLGGSTLAGEIREVLPQDLQLLNLASVWVPFQLTEDNKAARINRAKHIRSIFSAKACRFFTTSWQ